MKSVRNLPEEMEIGPTRFHAIFDPVELLMRTLIFWLLLLNVKWCTPSCPLNWHIRGSILWIITCRVINHQIRNGVAKEFQKYIPIDADMGEFAWAAALELVYVGSIIAAMFPILSGDWLLLEVFFVQITPAYYTAEIFTLKFVSDRHQAMQVNLADFPP